MPYRVQTSKEGWFVADDDGTTVDGPFGTRGEATDFILKLGEKERSAEVLSGAEARASALSDDALVAALRLAIDNPQLEQPARGRPPSHDAVGRHVALEYYWKEREAKATRRHFSEFATIKLLSRQFRCTPDFVRKCRRKYEPMTQWDDYLLCQLCLQARETKPKRVPPRREPASKRAQDFLRLALASGPLPSLEIRRRAARAEISKTTIDRAKRALGTEVQAVKSKTGWLWKLQERQ